MSMDSGPAPSGASRNDGQSLGRKRPDGQISKNLSIPVAENIPLNPSGKSALPARPVLSRQEGRIAIVTNAGRDAVDAAASARKVVAGRFFRELVSEQPARRTNGANAYGKTVWSWHPLLMPSWRRRNQLNR